MTERRERDDGDEKEMRRGDMNHRRVTLHLLPACVGYIYILIVNTLTYVHQRTYIACYIPTIHYHQNQNQAVLV